MDGQALKPHSLRLPKELDAQVRAYARTLATPGATARVPLVRALITLIEAGLRSVQPPPSSREALVLAMRELDPGWTGHRLADLEPVKVTPRSGRDPLEILKGRRG